MTRPPFDRVRVLEVSAGIPAAYCGKLMRDAGADVVKVEPTDGDPLRRWSAARGELPSAETGPLFSFLHGGKRSVVADADSRDGLFTDVDVVITDESADWTTDLIESAVANSPGTIVVTVTPFGRTGPYVDQHIEANEFILQAMCGSIGSRGWPDEMPFQAGGRIGEWISGGYAAVTVAAALRRQQRTGLGDRIDVSTFEAMSLVMGGIGAMTASVFGDAWKAPQRSTELPSIVKTKDGLVGLCVVTGQQFQDLLVLMERPDLIGDTDLASAPGRALRRDEFNAIVGPWGLTRTTEEIVDFATALRIPVSPIGTPRTVTEIDHFADRGVFVPNTTGKLQPRPPYLSSAVAALPPGAVPAVGEQDGQIHWPARTRPDPESGADPTERPLAGLRVIDLTAFWAGPFATQALAALGADIIKIEGLRRPDGMRFAAARPPSNDLWWETGAVFLMSNNDKRALTLELGQPAGRDIALDLIATADLVMENFSPRVMGSFGLDDDTIHSANPNVVFVRMPAFGLDGPWRDRVGFAQTMEQASGMAWMTGHADGLPVIPRGVCDPIAGLHAAFAALAGLEVRRQTGGGLQIESAMIEAALNVAAEAMLDADGDAVPHRDGNRGPGASPQGVYPCAGDDNWVAIAVLDDDQWPGLAGRLDEPNLADRADYHHEAGRRIAADEIDLAIRRWTSQRDVADVVTSLRTAGVAAARVAPAADLLHDEQLLARGFWQQVTHPVVGTYLTPTMPFQLASVTAPWIAEPAPLLGQHNREILTEVLGLDDNAVRQLAADNVIGTRPVGL